MYDDPRLMVLRKGLPEEKQEQFDMLLASQMKSPVVAIVLSLFFGWLGVDRFYIGKVGLGIGKLLTGGGFLIWWLIDLFLIMGATRQRNLEVALTVKLQIS